MRRELINRLKSDDGSVYRMLILTGSFFVLMFAHYLFKAGYGLAAIRFSGAKSIPLIDGTMTIIAIAMTVLISQVARLRIRLSAIIVTAATVSILIMMFYKNIASCCASILISLYLLAAAGQILLMLGLYAVWTLITSVFRKKPWIQIAVFGCGAQFAVIIASWLVRGRADSGDFSPLMRTAGAMYAFSFVLILLSLRAMPVFGGKETQRSSVETDFNCSFSAILSGLLSVVREPLLCYMTIFILLQSLVNDTIQWRMFKVVEHSVSNSQAVIIMADYYKHIGYLSLFAQATLVPLVFFFVPARLRVVLHPVIALLAAGGLCSTVGASDALLIVAGFRSLDYTLNNCMREAVFFPTSLRAKIAVRSVFSMLVPRLGSLFSAGVLLLLGGSPVIRFLTFLCAVAWVLVAAKLAAIYASIENAPLTEVCASADDVRDALL